MLAVWSDGLRPDPALTVSEWADRHRVLSSRASAEPGRYRTSRTPYMRDIMDALSPMSPVQRVVFMKAAQVGATEAGCCFIGFVIHHAPGPMLCVQPTVEMAKRASRQRIDPLIEESPAIRERVKPARSRDAGNTMLSKDFPGGTLVLTGANSAVGLRSMPARYLFLDEVDAYPASADEEGDPVGLAEARSLTFAHRRKVFLASTPTIRGLSRIEREYEVSDLRIARLAIDTGYEASAVYAWGRKVGIAQVSPIKGVEGFNRSSPVSGPTYVDATEGGKKIRRGARLWTVAVSTFKSETYRYLRLERPTDEDLAEGIRFPAGTVHLPSWADSEWCKQFVAEQLVTVKNRRGFTKLEWQKLRERNEALDCRVYARAAAWIAGADRWPEAKWRDLEGQLAVVASTSESQAGQVRRIARRPRRIIKFSGMQ
ncbi:MAG: hypothetical protein EPN20_03785 [Magnetospirillum sp.]|nr:MAG: hypothetical protein EPN20_03785 [Magnetospirillum sp.]